MVGLGGPEHRRAAVPLCQEQGGRAGFCLVKKQARQRGRGQIMFNTVIIHERYPLFCDYTMKDSNLKGTEKRR